MRGEEKSQKPRELIHNAQRQVIKWLYSLRRARRGNSDVAVERAREELHDATMIYFEQLKRFRTAGRINSMWNEDPVVEVGGEKLTLAELGEQRLRTEVVERRQPDPETMGEVTVREEQPWTLSPRQALQVIDALDDCANALGFDAIPTRDADETGAGKDGEQDPEEMNHLNTEVNVDVAGD